MFLSEAYLGKELIESVAWTSLKVMLEWPNLRREQVISCLRFTSFPSLPPLRLLNIQPPHQGLFYFQAVLFSLASPTKYM
jgi:hypothetical protein